MAVLKHWHFYEIVTETSCVDVMFKSRVCVGIRAWVCDWQFAGVRNVRMMGGWGAGGGITIVSVCIHIVSCSTSKLWRFEWKVPFFYDQVTETGNTFAFYIENKITHGRLVNRKQMLGTEWKYILINSKNLSKWIKMSPLL